MKKKILVIMICMLVITTVASFSTTAIKCERKPSTHAPKLNKAPYAPKVKIPCEVKRGSEFYIKAITTDPNNDNIYYKYDIDGSDYGWIGPYQSGEEFLDKIEMTLPVGAHTLGVKAKDTYNAESDWTYADFIVLKTKAITSPLLNFLYSHPNLFPMFRYLLGL
jgi:hypothetical protein